MSEAAEKFAVTPSRAVVRGVYFLFRAHKLEYVGRSRDCYKRIDTHRTNGREFDYATVMPCAESDLVWLEGALIAAFEPPQNRTNRRREEEPPRPPALIQPAAVVCAPPPPAMPGRRATDLLNRSQAQRLAKERGLGSELRRAWGSDLRIVPNGAPRRSALGDAWTPTVTTYAEFETWLTTAEKARLKRLGLQ